MLTHVDLIEKLLNYNTESAEGITEGSWDISSMSTTHVRGERFHNYWELYLSVVIQFPLERMFEWFEGGGVAVFSDIIHKVTF